MAWTLIEHADADALSTAVGVRLASLIQDALRDRSRAALALAGGRTSPPVFRRLAALSLAWERVTVVPSDERWVPYAHPDCNLRQLRDAFAAATGLRSLALVRQLPETLDAVLLGMGADGHFASLFPGAPTLRTALDLGNRDDAAAILPDPLPSAGPHPRISLTLARLLRSRAVLLAITGTDKRATLSTAMADAKSYPVGALLHAPAPRIEIHWSP
jgi:6-phosphogluconolactonase